MKIKVCYLGRPGEGGGPQQAAAAGPINPGPNPLTRSADIYPPLLHPFLHTFPMQDQSKITVSLTVWWPKIFFFQSQFHDQLNTVVNMLKKQQFSLAFFSKCILILITLKQWSKIVFRNKNKPIFHNHHLFSKILNSFTQGKITWIFKFFLFTKQLDLSLLSRAGNSLI